MLNPKKKEILFYFHMFTKITIFPFVIFSFKKSFLSLFQTATLKVPFNFYFF